VHLLVLVLFFKILSVSKKNKRTFSLSFFTCITYISFAFNVIQNFIWSQLKILVEQEMGYTMLAEKKF
jgi:hypothetical protein